MVEYGRGSQCGVSERPLFSERSEDLKPASSAAQSCPLPLGSCVMSGGQALQRFGHRFGNGPSHSDNHRVLVFTGLLKCLELTAQQTRRHITVLALHDPRVDYTFVVFFFRKTSRTPCRLPMVICR